MRWGALGSPWPRPWPPAHLPPPGPLPPSPTIRSPTSSSPPSVQEKPGAGAGGVQKADFAVWLRGVPEAIATETSLYASLTLAELQRKAHTYLMAVAAAPPTAGISLEVC